MSDGTIKDILRAYIDTNYISVFNIVDILRLDYNKVGADFEKILEPIRDAYFENEVDSTKDGIVDLDKYVNKAFKELFKYVKSLSYKNI